MNRDFLSTWGHSRTLDRERLTAFRNEVPISYIAIAGTLISILAFTVEGGIGLIGLLGGARWAKSVELLVGKGLVGFFLFSGLSRVRHTLLSAMLPQSPTRTAVLLMDAPP